MVSVGLASPATFYSSRLVDTKIRNYPHQTLCSSRKEVAYYKSGLLSNGKAWAKCWPDWRIARHEGSVAVVWKRGHDIAKASTNCQVPGHPTSRTTHRQTMRENWKMLFMKTKHVNVRTSEMPMGSTSGDKTFPI